MNMFFVIAAGLVMVLVMSVFLFPGAVYQFVMRAERRLAGLTTRTIDIDGISYRYNDSGKGVPLLLVHGFSADKDHWTRVARHLTGQYRVIAPDLPGFGESSRDPALDYSIASQVERVGAFADKLGLDAFHLGGSSMGGAIAASFAARYPDRVRSLWLLAPAGVDSGKLSEMEQIIEAGGAHPLIPGNRREFEDTLDFVFAKRPFLPAPLRRYLTQVAIDSQALLVQIFAGLVEIGADGKRSSVNTLLSGLDIPTLLVWGTQDRVLHPAGAETLGALLPNAVVEILPGMGHLPMLENPRQAAEHYLRFQQNRLP